MGAAGQSLCDARGGALKLSDKAKEVYRIAERHGVAALLVQTVDDLDAFAELLDVSDDDSVLLALYLKTCSTTTGGR